MNKKLMPAFGQLPLAGGHMAVKGVLVDIDGTLLLSNDAHAQAWVEAFAVADVDVPFEKVRPLIGMGGDLLLPKVAPGLSSQEGKGKVITKYRKELVVHEFIPRLTPTPGARELILKMQAAGLKLVVASSASSEELEGLLKSAQVNDLLPEATTSGDVETAKPAPDIVEAALDKIQLPSDQVLMLGDTPYDIESAGKAGVSVIALRSGGFKDEDLAGAIAIYDDPADLLRQYDSSPLHS